MKIIVRIALIAFVAAFLAMLSACNTTPERRWAAEREALTAAEGTVLNLHKAGIIPDQEFTKMNDVVASAREALAVAKTQLPAGGNTFEDWMEVFKAALARFAESERAHLAPSH